jgi:hypothetical protein
MLSARCAWQCESKAVRIRSAFAGRTLESAWAECRQDVLQPSFRAGAAGYVIPSVEHYRPIGVLRHILV